MLRQNERGQRSYSLMNPTFNTQFLKIIIVIYIAEERGSLTSINLLSIKNMKCNITIPTDILSDIKS